MPSLLFVLHGMGVHDDPHWCDAVTDRLDRVAARYHGFDLDDQRFSRQVRVVPITYDEPFRGLLAGWNREAGRVHETIVEERIRGAPDVVRWLAELDGQRQQAFFWSHLVDVLLYQFFDAVAKQVRLRVIDQVLEAMAAARDEEPTVRVTFLAHSLGTAVLHDSLALLSTQTRVQALEGPGFRFDAAFMLANVSRVLEDDHDRLRVYESVVAPPNALNLPHWFHAYWNVRHRLDPIAAVRAFAPAHFDPEHYTDVRLSHVSGLNVHGFTQHLDHPDVHVPLIAMAAGRLSLRLREPPYEIPTPPCVEAVRRLEDQARALLALLQGARDPFDLIRGGVQFLALVEDAREACRAESGQDDDDDRA